MDLPQLVGPDGKPIPADKSFIVDGNGNPISAASLSRDFALPPAMSVTAIISGAEKTFLAGSFDEALKHSYQNSRSMFRDCRIMGWVEERRDSVTMLPWRLRIEDEKDPMQQAVRDGMTAAMKRIPHFRRILNGILKWALWGGRGASHLCWDWVDMELPIVQPPPLFPNAGQMYGDEENGAMNGLANGQANGQMQPGMNGDGQGGMDDGQEHVKPDFEKQSRPVLMPVKNMPCNGDNINYTWGYTAKGSPPGTPLMRVYGGISAEMEDTEIVYDNMGPNIALTGTWRERFCIMNHDPDAADYYAPEMAGGIWGVGIRSRIYWVNFVRQSYAQWITDLYDRLGLGFVVIKYDMASTEAKRKAEEAAKKWNRRSVLTIPVTTDQLQKSGSIEVIEVPMNGAVVVQEIVKYFDKMIERYILRQTVGGGGGSQGDGMRGTVGPAEMASKQEAQRIKADAEELAEAITGSYDEPGIVSTMLRWTYPGLWDDNKKQFKFPLWFEFEIPDREPKDQMQAFVMGTNMGVELKADQVRSVIGAEKPGPGDETVGGKKPGMGAPPGEGPPGEEGDDVDSKSRAAAMEWISGGKLPNTMKDAAERNGISRQALAQAARRIEGPSSTEN